MATKKRKKSVPKCAICKKPRKDPDGFVARIEKGRVCLNCALNLVKY